MPRNGVSFDQVAAVADGMLAEGVSPTIKNVRELLGTGSGNTIHRHLNIWREARPQLVAASSELPSNIILAISREIDRAKSATRAEIEDRLVVIQAEAAELASTGETMEADLDKLMEELSALTTDRDMLLGKFQEQTGELERMTSENERERYSAEQARIEVAQLRNKLDMQTEKLMELTATTDILTSEKFAESQARIIAERETAVLAAKLESAIEMTRALLLQKDTLITQIDAERQSAETARIMAAKIAHELELQSVDLMENKSAIKELTGFYETEKKARIGAELKISALETRLDEQSKTIVPTLQSPLPE